MKKIWIWISNLVGNNLSTRYLIFLFIALFIVTARCSHADELHLEFGATVLHGNGPYLGFYYRWERPHDIDIETGLDLFGYTKYENYSLGNNWAPYALVDVRASRFNIGIGIARLQLVDGLDGSHVNITLKTGYQFADRWGADIRHWSNAGTTARNVGRNAVLLDWKLR